MPRGDGAHDESVATVGQWQAAIPLVLDALLLLAGMWLASRESKRPRRRRDEDLQEDD